MLGFKLGPLPPKWEASVGLLAHMAAFGNEVKDQISLKNFNIYIYMCVCYVQYVIYVTCVLYVCKVYVIYILYDILYIYKYTYIGVKYIILRKKVTESYCAVSSLAASPGL